MLRSQYFLIGKDIEKLYINLFLATASPGIAVLTSSSTLCRRYAPEQGTGPDTVNTAIKLRLLAVFTARVSTAIRRHTLSKKRTELLMPVLILSWFGERGSNSDGK